MRATRILGVSFVSTALLAAGLGLAACSSSASPPGGGGSEGDLSSSDAVITGTVTQCTGTMADPLPDEMVAACTIPGCSDAACIPQDLILDFVSADTDLSLLGNCGDPTVLCVPIDFIATTGKFMMKTCTSVAGAEGRCVSTCVPQVAERMDQLPQADCAPTERCAPCFDPTQNGLDTKACSQGCDTGPTQPAVVFQECGSGLGQCVPAELIPPDLQAAVPVADCTEPGFVCAPKTHVADINYDFPDCVPSSDLLMAAPGLDGPNGEKGGCVPAYLVDAVDPPPPEGAVLQDTCDPGFLCAPCTNPLALQAPTGACPTQ